MRNDKLLKLPWHAGAPAIELINANEKPGDKNEWDGISRMVKRYLGPKAGAAAVEKIDRFSATTGGLCADVVQNK